MKIAYSPYNRTFKYICLQNQLAHNKNKSNVKSLTKTNISISYSIDKNKSSIRRSEDSTLNNLSSNFVDPPRALHLSQFYSRRVQKEQNGENERLAKRLCNASCRVITKDLAEKDFSNHLSYKKIATKYDEQGKPKELVKLNDSLTASKVQLINSPSQFCTLKNSRKVSTGKLEKGKGKGKGKRPRSKVIRLY